MAILKSKNKITDFFMILAWASPFKYQSKLITSPLSRREKHAREWRTVADLECARGGGVSHILDEKVVLASLYSKKCMKM